MKKVFLLKALVIIVPVLVAIYAQYYEHKQQKQLKVYYKADCTMETSIKTNYAN